MWALAIDRGHWRLNSLRHGRFPRPRSQILATPRRKALLNDLTPLCPCSQASSAAVLTALSLCIAGSQCKRAMAESHRPWPGQGRWEMQGDRMRGRETERGRIKESERARDLHCRLVARRVVLCHPYVCRMHSCASMSALDSGEAKEVYRFKIFVLLPSQQCEARPRCSPWPKVLAKGRCSDHATHTTHTGGYPHRTKRDAGRCPRGSSKARGVAEHAGLAWYC